jgi:dipeptidyl-peptidase 4
LDRAENGKYEGCFVWASEKTGFRHLYLHEKDGICIAPLTQGDWMVDQVVAVNECTDLIYFTGTLDGPLESHLYQTNLFPDCSHPLQTPKRLTCGTGWHSVILDHQLLRFIDVYESVKSPPVISLCSLIDGSVIFSMYQPVTVPRLINLQRFPPEIVLISAKDGSSLYANIYLSDEKQFGPPPYRTLIRVYGGPGVQFVYDSWNNTVDMRAQYFRSKGILVWKVCVLLLLTFSS